MAVAFLVIAAIVDLALAALLIGVSGFMFGASPESLHGAALAGILYAAAVIGCVVAPVAGFILDRYGKSGAGLAVAWLPPGSALIALMLPAPY